MVDAKTIEMVFLVSLLALGLVNIFYFAPKTAFLGEDEATYVSMGEEFAKLGLYAPFTSAGKYNIAPPFMPFVYASFFMVFGPSLAIAKSVTAASPQ